ncbi:hypothetical protein GOQ30_12505 [Flavobacterium sp. TP390]|uniref:CpXC domain-containing protein n=1 Tax=Flavobacterium profundi TaxID=1774945 RepID=A0A6I4ISZ2_9FLAO|nr:CpXC domain-containing protein [Flavobacterium profundi]MVO09984.1 hypothetical protein [Flavobacterium profundi]
MSLSTTISENCPHCNSIQEIEYYQTVNITADPNLKDKVLNGTLNSKICTDCLKEINIFSGFLYHDMKNRLMFEVKVSDKQDERKTEVINEFKKNGYIYREIYSYPELVEKIHIFDNNLNDSVIENISNKLKAMLDESLKQIKEPDSEINFNVFFKKIENGFFKKKIVFYCFSHPSQMMEMKYDFKNLTESEKKNLYNIEILRS